MNARRWIARHDTASFLILTYVLSWPLWLASGVLQRTPMMAPNLPWWIAQLGVFAPALAGLIVGAVLEPDGRRRAWRTVACVYAPAAALGLWIASRRYESFARMDAPSNWATVALGVWVLVWFGAARRRSAPWGGPAARRTTVAWWSLGCVLAPTALFVLAWGLTGGEGAGAAGGLGGGSASLPPLPARALTLFGVLSALAVNLCFGGSLGEEPGWRGAWLPRLLRRHSAFGATAIISFWWALWHAPIDFTQGFALPGIGGLLVRQFWTLPVSVLFTWVALRGGGSLLPPLALHTTINSFADFVAVQPARMERAAGLFFVFCLAAAVAALIADRRVWMPAQPSGGAGPGAGDSAAGGDAAGRAVAGGLGGGAEAQA
jgi:membrane protease YdiL (CAAX protease family)